MGEVKKNWTVECDEYQGEWYASSRNLKTRKTQWERPPEVPEWWRDEEYNKKLPKAKAEAERRRLAAQANEVRTDPRVPDGTGSPWSVQEMLADDRSMNRPRS